MNAYSRRRELSPSWPLVWCILVAALVGVFVGCGETEGPEQTGEQAQSVSSGPPGSRDEEPEAVQPGARPGTQLIAKINDQPVTQEDLDLEVEALMRRVFGGRIPPDKQQDFRARIEPSAFRQLVLKAQLGVYAEANGLKVEEAQIDEEVEKILSRFGGGEQAQDVLRKAGLTQEELRQDVARGALMDSAVQHYLAALPRPATAEIETYYQEHLDRFTQPEQVVARHILIRATPEEEAASKQTKFARAEEIRKELLDGADFAEAARKYSEGPTSVNGGLLDPFSRGDMVPEFEKAAFELEPGAISEIVETKFGFHIIQVSSHDPEVVKKLDQIQPDVLKQIEQEAIAQWFENLVAEAKVERL